MLTLQILFSNLLNFFILIQLKSILSLLLLQTSKDLLKNQNYTPVLNSNKELSPNKEHIKFAQVLKSINKNEIEKDE